MESTGDYKDKSIFSYLLTFYTAGYTQYPKPGKTGITKYHLT